MRNTLKYDGAGLQARHRRLRKLGLQASAAGRGHALIALPNVLPDLAATMKRNPTMKVMVNGGYFDVSTPYYEGWFEMHHLPIPPSLQEQSGVPLLQSGHMVYVHAPALRQFHDNVASFIRDACHVTLTIVLQWAFVQKCV